MACCPARSGPAPLWHPWKFRRGLIDTQNQIAVMGFDLAQQNQELTRFGAWLSAGPEAALLVAPVVKSHIGTIPGAQVVTIPDAARHLGQSEETVQQLVLQGQIPGFRASDGGWMVCLDLIEEGSINDMDILVRASLALDRLRGEMKAKDTHVEELNQRTRDLAQLIVWLSTGQKASTELVEVLEECMTFIKSPTGIVLVVLALLILIDGLMECWGKPGIFCDTFLIHRWPDPRT